jgi:glycosyltransferase involved in cell wall biosynthesis
MKIAFNRTIRRQAWGGGAHFHSAMTDILEKKGYIVTNELTPDVDIVFMLDPRYEDGGFGWEAIAAHKRLYRHVKVLHRVNECDARNNSVNNINHQLIQANSIADHTIFISEWLRSHLAKQGLQPTSSEVIYNGCRLDWFYPIENKPQSLVNIGRKIRLVTHHWSDNRLKGFDLYDALDKFVEKNPQYEFTYIGRYNKSYTPQNTRIIPPMYGPELGNELRKHDVYVTASRNEPCGLHHIEAAASGLPVLFHTDSGGIYEGAIKTGLPFSNSDTFMSSLAEIVKHYGLYCRRIFDNDLSADKCCEIYLNTIERMLLG